MRTDHRWKIVRYFGNKVDESTTRDRKTAYSKRLHLEAVVSTGSTILRGLLRCRSGMSGYTKTGVFFLLRGGREGLLGMGRAIFTG